jgi:hypothetical protein
MVTVVIGGEKQWPVRATATPKGFVAFNDNVWTRESE